MEPRLPDPIPQGDILQAILDHTHVQMAYLDLQLNFVTVNAAYVRGCGYAKDQLLGRNHFALFPHAENQAIFARVRDTGEPARFVARPFVFPGRPELGTTYWDWTLVPVHDAGGAVQGLLLSLVDVTDRERMCQAEKLAIVGRLSASLTHELSNPLHSVMGCLGLASEALAAGKSAERYLAVAHAELRRAADILSHLRDLLRRPLAQDKEPTDLGPLVEHVLTLVEKRCADRGIEISRRVEPGLPPVLVARDQVVQVLLNVILNAVDALPGGGLLGLEAGAVADPPGVAVAVTDTGEGMGQGTLARLFEPFYSTRRDGLGLGLYVSRNIIHDHGGRIDVVSEEGRGSTFRIWLPA